MPPRRSPPASPSPSPDTTWAEQEFGHADLGDRRLTRRLVALAAQAAVRPAGLVSAIFADDARAREAAYDFLENVRVAPAALAAAHHAATARRCAEHPRVFCAVDGSSLQYADADGARGLGALGPRSKGAKGLKTLLGLALAPDGTPLGVLGTRLWARGPKAARHHHQRALEDKETRFWHEVLDQAVDALAPVAPACRLWFVLDREGDSWTLLRKAEALADEGHWTTIRAKADRRLVRDPDGADEAEPGGKLFEALARAPVEATYELPVPAGPGRRARTARLTLRFQELTLAVGDKRATRRQPARVWVVLVQEQGPCPAGEAPVCWRLLTTRPVESVEDACQVVDGYGLRWRIEQLHEAMKERGMRLEDSQLQARDHLERFVVLGVALAVRVLRLVYLARERPERPATDELTPREVQALAWRKGLAAAERASLTMGEAVGLLAKLGGHIGPPARRPIGYRVVVRGLCELRPLVQMLAEGLGPAEPA
ncbi:MAG TPA: IS4 family transposase [Polyangiaceae bacterium]|nr:IS4 family transposase [Polyangiaceae bacterium]